MTGITLNSDFVRSHFPGLSGEWVFFDNAGGSQILNSVVERISDYLLHCNVQLGATYDISRQAGQRLAEATAATAAFLNAADPGEIVMGSSTSMLLKILSWSVAQTLKPGDEIVVTNCDHEANIGPWRDLESRGAVIREWRLNPETLELSLSDLERLMTPRTRIVAMTHASNILGSINPVAEAARLVHSYNARLCVDGVAYAPHRCIDVQALDADFYVLSFYKVYGPHHAALYGKKDLLLALPGINHFFIPPTESSYKFQPGHMNYELTSGLMGLYEYIGEFHRFHYPVAAPPAPHEATRLAYDIIAEHEESLAAPLLDFLSRKPGVRIIGHTEPDKRLRVPTISFTVKNRRSSEIPPETDKHRLAIRYGDFYARRLISDLGLEACDGVVRISMVHYNTLSEVYQLIEALERIIR